MVSAVKISPERIIIITDRHPFLRIKINICRQYNTFSCKVISCARLFSDPGKLCSIADNIQVFFRNDFLCFAFVPDTRTVVRQDKSSLFIFRTFIYKGQIMLQSICFSSASFHPYYCTSRGGAFYGGNCFRNFNRNQMVITGKRICIYRFNSFRHHIGICCFT